MTRLVIDLDDPAETVARLRKHLASDACRDIIYAIEAAATGKQYVVLDPVQDGFDGRDLVLRHAADHLAPMSVLGASVLNKVASRMQPPVDPRVQRVLDVAEETGVEIDHAQAKLIADVLLPEGVQS